jgi:hypothetical protein
MDTSKANEWFTMAAGTLFMGGLGFLIAKSLTGKKPIIYLSAITGLIIGAAVSVKIVQSCKTKE